MAKSRGTRWRLLGALIASAAVSACHNGPCRDPGFEEGERFRITVLTSAENDTVQCLTFADLYALVGPEAEGVGSWDEAEAFA